MLEGSHQATVVGVVLVVCVVSLFLSVFLFDHDYSKQEPHCNTHVCAESIAISAVSFGLFAIGNPIAVGVVSVSSFCAIGILPIAPIAIGVLPIGLSVVGWRYINLLEN